MYKQLFENSFGAYLVINTEYQIVAVNKAARKRLNIDTSVNPAPYLNQYINIEHLREKLALSLTMSNWIPASSKSVEGEETQLDLNLRRFNGENGDLLIGIHIERMGRARKAFRNLREARRVTSQKMNELHRLQENLKASNLRLESFAFRAAHDMRAPLRHISMGLQIASDRSISEGQRTEFITLARSSADKLTTLIQDLLHYSKSINSKPNNVDLNLKEEIHSILPLIAKYEDAPDWLTIHPLPNIRCDPALTRIIFQNILSNSYRFKDKTRPLDVVIRSRHDDTDIIIEIEDNGIGFDNQFADKIFQPFERLGSDVEGSGIGLSTCSELAKVQGWTISAFGTPDKGAVFTITIPNSDATFSK